jgi:dimethylhistidine N-methyltransferase
MLDRPRPTPASPAEDFSRAVLDGLAQTQRALPCRFFYDAAGSALFEEITRLPEYYPTRTEAAILAACADEIATATPAGSVLVEFGSGSSRKTELLLAALPSLAAYVPIDVSPDALAEAAARLAGRFPGLRVLPVEGDFLAPIDLPPDLADRPRLGFFPGSTIGNFSPDEACDLLRGMTRSLGPEGRLVVGVDLRKDPETLVRAYDDAAGVTAQFNLNLLARANRELGATFDIASFAHEAVFNAVESRIEMHLVSRRAQTVEVLGHRFRFAEGERIHTENSYKYGVAKFRALAAQAGWQPRRVWTDPAELFSVHELGRADAAESRLSG